MAARAEASRAAEQRDHQQPDGRPARRRPRRRGADPQPGRAPHAARARTRAAGRRLPRVCSSVPALSDVIDECLETTGPILRRSVTVPESTSGVSHLGVTVSPLFDENGALHGAICLFTDLTAVKQLEEQLRLKESLATVGELTAGIAHEFRNGLATIHGYSKLFDLDDAAGHLPAVRRRAFAPRPSRARRGRDQLPQLRAAGAADADRRWISRRSASARPRRCAARRGSSAATSPCAATFGGGRRRRGAAAPGVQQPAAQRRRSVRGRARSRRSS